jgi:hypothetical protein
MRDERPAERCGAAARPSFWARLRFALWLFWRSCTRRNAKDS